MQDDAGPQIGPLALPDFGKIGSETRNHRTIVCCGLFVIAEEFG